MHKRTIAFYIEFGTSYAGAPRNLYNLICELNRQRFTPVVITNKPSPLTEALESIGVKPVVLDQPAIIGTDDGLALRGGTGIKLAAWRELRRYNQRIEQVLAEREARLLWVRNVKGVLLTNRAANRLHIPLIWDIGMEKPSHGAMWFLHMLAFRRVEKVVTEGSFVAGTIFTPWQLRRFGHKIQANPTSVPRDRVAKVRRERFDASPPWDPFVVLNLALLNPRKNQMMLLKAMAELAGRFPALHVQLVGPTIDEAYEQALRHFVAEHGLEDRVEFLGWQDDVARFLHAAHLFALTSRIEGVPQAVLEAMHARVPVLATAAGGVPDVVENGKTGFLVDIDDQQAFTAALEHCLTYQEELPRIAERAQQRIDEQFTAEQWYRRYEKLFDQLLSENRTS